MQRHRDIAFMNEPVKQLTVGHPKCRIGYRVVESIKIKLSNTRREESSINFNHPGNLTVVARNEFEVRARVVPSFLPSFFHFPHQGRHMVQLKTAPRFSLCHAPPKSAIWFSSAPSFAPLLAFPKVNESIGKRYGFSMHHLRGERENNFHEGDCITRLRRTKACGRLLSQFIRDPEKKERKKKRKI